MLKRYNLPIILPQTVLVVLFSVLVFFLADDDHKTNLSFLISFGFMIASLFTGEILLILVDYKKKNDKSINEFILFVPANLLAFVIFFVVSFIFLFAQASNAVIVSVIDGILYFLYLSYLFLVTFIVKKQAQVRKEIKTKVNYIRLLESDLLSIAESVQDRTFKERLENLAHDVRFSDPMSDKSLKPIEEEMNYLCDDIKVDIENNDLEGAKAKADKLSRLLKERNRKCKILK